VARTTIQIPRYATIRPIQRGRVDAGSGELGESSVKGHKELQLIEKRKEQSVIH
jgi:hypothetical protein